jgi:hypothetical protein
VSCGVFSAECFTVHSERECFSEFGDGEDNCVVTDSFEFFFIGVERDLSGVRFGSVEKSIAGSVGFEVGRVETDAVDFAVKEGLESSLVFSDNLAGDLVGLVLTNVFTVGVTVPRIVSDESELFVELIESEVVRTVRS